MRINKYFLVKRVNITNITKKKFYKRGNLERNAFIMMLNFT